MKQILQSLSNGQTTAEDVPCPKNLPGHLLIATRKTLVSAGTERMLVEFGKAGYLAKARQQPDKVKQVLSKVKTDGLLTTVDAVRSKLDQPLALGYCNAGIVLESDVKGFSTGDRVVSNGSHAEVVRVPKNLCVKIPDEVDDESAAFTVLAAIGLQGIRLIQPTIGETMVVTGLGLIGLMCVQILRANGCRVLGIDTDRKKCDLARKFGAEGVDISQGEDPLFVAKTFSRGRGVDGVLITASTSSDEVMQQSAEMCRKRGRIVLVGVVGLNLRRDDFFKKELSFQVSASYGPGRYDPNYEDKGQDYPVGFVRWTEQRNFEAVLDMMAAGTLDPKPLVTHHFSIDGAVEAYALLSDSSALGIVLSYPERPNVDLRSPRVLLQSKEIQDISPKKASPVVGFAGAGNYASRILIPAFKQAGAVLNTLTTSGGVSGVHHGKKSGFYETSTEFGDILKNPSINMVAIATRHDAHAKQIVLALEAGKHVFVEKPLALNLSELDSIENAYSVAQSRKSPSSLMVGFNRRFAPHVLKMKALLDVGRSPKSLIMTVNAGVIPAEHWTQNLEVGGGRIIGEGCHFVDLLRFLVGHPITGFQAMMIGEMSGTIIQEDKVSFTLQFADGSVGTVHYLANGHASFPKERLEVFCEERVLQLDNYLKLKGFGWPVFKKMHLRQQDKGQKACAAAFVESVRRGNPSPIPFSELLEVSKVTIKISEQLRSE